MSIISKNKSARGAIVSEFYAEISKLKQQRADAEAVLEAAESDALVNALEILNAHGPMTADELSRATGGELSKMEVVGNLPLSGRPRSVRGHSRYAVLNQQDIEVTSYPEYQTKTFAEVDENGNLIPGGAVKKVHRKVTVYETYGKTAACKAACKAARKNHR